MMTEIEASRRQLIEQVEIARRDLAEIDVQLETGEIGPETHATLRQRYADELARLTEALETLSGSEVTATPPTRSRARLLIGAGIIVAGLAASIVLAATLSQDRGNETLQGVASGDALDPESYSDETLEAVIAAYADDPTVADQMPFMRFRLAERYFDRGEFTKAYPHYTAVLETGSDAGLVASSLTRLAWIVWIGNGETDLAVGLLDRAIEIAPDPDEARYVKGQVVWCGLGDADAASVLFRRVLESETLDPESRSQVEANLEAAVGGEGCSLGSGGG